MKHFSSEMDPFRAASAPIGANTAGQDALRQPAIAFAERQSQVRALSIIGPAGGKAPRRGKSPHPAPGSLLTPKVIPVAKNLHLTNFLLIFRRDSGERQ
jgi:hypothetical protein